MARNERTIIDTEQVDIERVADYLEENWVQFVGFMHDYGYPESELDDLLDAMRDSTRLTTP